MPTPAPCRCSLEQQTQELITEYCNKYRSTQPPPQQAATASFLSRPSITAGAFYLTAKKHKAGVDKSVLLVKTGLTRKELDNIIASIFKLCEGSLIPAKGKGKGMAREAAAGQGTKAGVSGGSQQQESG